MVGVSGRWPPAEVLGSHDDDSVGEEVSMPRVRDVLQRFRPSGAPGAATAAGVPADRAHELAAELEPVFALLADTERECADIVDRARRAESGIRVREAERARGVLAAGRARVEAERAAAAARSRGREGRATGEEGPPPPGDAASERRGPPDPDVSQSVRLVVEAVRSLLEDGTGRDGPRAGAR
jgi:hypothetical protein